MNTITHNETLSFIQSVEHVAHNCTTEEFEELDSTSLILAVISVVMDNADEWVSHLELAITKNGYELRYEPAESVIGMGMDHIVLDLINRGLEVLTEDLKED